MGQVERKCYVDSKGLVVADLVWIVKGRQLEESSLCGQRFTCREGGELAREEKKRGGSGAGVVMAG